MNISRIKKYFQINAYQWALLLAAIACFTVLLPLYILFFLHTGILPPIEYLWIPFAGMSLLLSGSGYIGKALGFIKNFFLRTFSKKYNSEEEIFTGENIGVTVGIIAGLVLACISLTVFHEISSFPIFGGIVLSAVNYFSTYGGLSNRIGRGVFDHARNKASVDTNYAYGIKGGALVGLILVIVILAVFHPAMAVIPLVLASFSVIGMCASVSGYIGRVFDHFLGNDTNFVDLITNPEKRVKVFNWENFSKMRTTQERVGTLFGGCFGIICGAILVAKGLFLTSFFGAGIPVVITGILMIATCANAGAGFGNRLGHLFGTFAAASKDNSEISKPKQIVSQPEEQKNDFTRTLDKLTNIDIKVENSVTVPTPIAVATQKRGPFVPKRNHINWRKSCPASIRKSKRGLTMFAPSQLNTIHSSAGDSGVFKPDGEDKLAVARFSC